MSTEPGESGAGSTIDTGKLIRSLFAGLEETNQQLVAYSGGVLGQIADVSEQFRPAIVEGLVSWVVRRPHHSPALRTLATIFNHRESVVKETLLDLADRRQAKVLYDRLLTTRPYELEVRGKGIDYSLLDIGGTGPVRVPRAVLDRYASEHIDDRVVSSPSRERAWSQWSRRERLQRMDNGSAFVAIESASRFDEFDFLGPETETRYGYAVQTRTFRDSQEDIAIVRLYQEHGEPAFYQALTDAFTDWERIDTDGVVDIVEWGDSPQPWVATEFTEQTLWERGQLSPEEALRTAEDLTAALAELHQRELIHGGIDPHSIRYSPTVFDERSEPLFDNVGLARVYHDYDEPSGYIDPRYVAPEYFDDRFGSIDRTTDIYQLGMALYTACTGEPPYEGSSEEIRRQVLSDHPLGMSPENPDLPGTLGEILMTATAREKMQRFETATQFHQAVRNLCADLLE